MIRELIDPVSRRLGISLHRWPGPHTVLRHLQLMFERLHIDCVFDIGANRGQFAESLRKEIGFDGVILSFEPHPELQGMLREKSAGVPNWHVFSHALGDQPGARNLNLTQVSDNSSFLDPTDYGRQTFGERLTLESICEVEVARLDELYAELQSAYGFRRPFLKMDTQGFDLKVLEGARGVWPQFCGLLTEAALKKSYADMPDMTETLDAVRAAGFDPTGFFPVATDPDRSLVEVDCVAQRRPGADQLAAA